MGPQVKDLYWAAGFLEGEGYFQASPKYRGNVYVGASQVQKEPLEKLETLFGGAFCRKFYKNETSQPQWVWKLTGSKGVALMMTLFPLLSEKRKEQVKRALTTWRSWGVAAKHRSTCKLGHPLDGRDCRGKRCCTICRRNSWRAYARTKRSITYNV